MRVGILDHTTGTSWCFLLTGVIPDICQGQKGTLCIFLMKINVVLGARM
jgi:hypothetical protein